VFLAPAAWAASTMDSRYTGSAIAPVAGPVGELGPGGLPRGPIPDGAAGGVLLGPPPGAADGRGGPAISERPSRPVQQVIAYLKSHDPGSEYLLATLGRQGAREYILAGESVLAIGGFTGEAPSTTPERLAALVAEGKLRYVLLGMGPIGRGGSGNGNSAAVRSWVTGHCTEVTEVPVYGIYHCVTV